MVDQLDTIIDSLLEEKEVRVVSRNIGDIIAFHFGEFFKSPMGSGAKGILDGIVDEIVEKLGDKANKKKISAKIYSAANKAASRIKKEAKAISKATDFGKGISLNDKQIQSILSNLDILTKKGWGDYALEVAGRIEDDVVKKLGYDPATEEPKGARAVIDKVEHRVGAIIRKVASAAKRILGEEFTALTF